MYKDKAKYPTVPELFIQIVQMCIKSQIIVYSFSFSLYQPATLLKYTQNILKTLLYRNYSIFL